MPVHEPDEQYVHNELHAPSFAFVTALHEPDTHSLQSEMQFFPVSRVIPTQLPPAPLHSWQVPHSAVSPFTLFVHEPEMHDVHWSPQFFPSFEVMPAQFPPAESQAWQVPHSVVSPANLLLYWHVLDTQLSIAQSSCTQFDDVRQHHTPPGPGSPAQSGS